MLRICPYCLCDVPPEASSIVCLKSECQKKQAEAKAIYERLKRTSAASDLQQLTEWREL